jgi:hypothetical protein
MNIILAGIIGRYPYGGVAWCSLMYLLGLRDLGHNVWYLEDTGECNYDPIQNALAAEPIYATNFIQQCLAPHGFADRWCYIDHAAKYHGHTEDSWKQICKNADLFLDLSGGCWFWRDEYAAIPRSAFIDSDPAFTQLAIAKGETWYVDFFKRFTKLFTFGRNIGTPASDVPTSGFTWHPTWQPVIINEWTPLATPPRNTFTTVMTWQIESFTDTGGNKDQEFLKFLDLPRRVNVPLELAVNGPQQFLRQHGWICRDAFAVSSNLDDYRNYIRNSMAEFSVAKHTYVRTNSGWFSDRTECYLAAGRPAVVQDTGFSAHLPTGEGLFAYRTIEQAADAIHAIASDYARHSKRSHEIAEAHFSPRATLVPLLDSLA